MDKDTAFKSVWSKVMKIKGNIIKSRLNFVQERFGEAAWKRVLAAMSEDDQQTLSGMIMAIGWYPFDIGERLDDAIVEVVGGGRTEFFEEIGRASARENLTGVHRRLLDPHDPLTFMGRAQVIYSFYYDTGYRTWESAGPTSGVLTTFNAETFSKTDCLTVIGWYKEALAMCGASNIDMVEETCRATGGEFCRYRVSWSQ